MNKYETQVFDYLREFSSISPEFILKPNKNGHCLPKYHWLYLKCFEALNAFSFSKKSSYGFYGNENTLVYCNTIQYRNEINNYFPNSTSELICVNQITFRTFIDRIRYLSTTAASEVYRPFISELSWGVNHQPIITNAPVKVTAPYGKYFLQNITIALLNYHPFIRSVLKYRFKNVNNNSEDWNNYLHLFTGFPKVEISYLPVITQLTDLSFDN